MATSATVPGSMTGPGNGSADTAAHPTMLGRCERCERTRPGECRCAGVAGTPVPRSS
ncbi:MAG TPA: hypothetical protein VK586_01270 [Streptosporangiaceae bacterium]|nr:hypothetical protein [Streptosporangiaceae bacterium]